MLHGERGKLKQKLVHPGRRSHCKFSVSDENYGLCMKSYPPLARKADRWVSPHSIDNTPIHLGTQQLPACYLFNLHAHTRTHTHTDRQTREKDKKEPKKRKTRFTALRLRRRSSRVGCHCCLGWLWRYLFREEERGLRCCLNVLALPPSLVISDVHVGCATFVVSDPSTPSTPSTPSACFCF